MPVYEYTALDIKGKKITGIIDAASATTARQRLRETRIYPVELREASVKKKEEPLARRPIGSFFKKVGLPQIAAMTRQLSTLLIAGLPLVPSLNILAAQTAHPQMKKVLAQIKEEINEGNSLSRSISHFPGIFPPFYINMIRAGEASGMMDPVLERLADFYEKQQTLRGKIKTALAYPLFMFTVGCIIMFFLVTFVVPNITKIFDEMHQTLPLITVLLITVSETLKAAWWALLILLIALAAAGNYAVMKTGKGRYLWDKLKLKLPLIGPLNQKLAVARFSRTLGTLLQSGVPLLTSLEIVRNIVNNILISTAIQEAAKEVEEGQSLSSPLSRSGLFPAIATEMIAVGEQSGNLEAMLYRISDAYEKEVESSIFMITSIMEPVMILVMGLIVGFIVISVLLPIFEMNQLVR